MDLGEINPVLLVASLMVAATPLLLAAIGELVVEKAGVLNLGVEGMMIVGAISGFAISVETGSPWLGFVAAAIGGAVLSLLFVLLTQVALANQVASGLALTLFGLGFSALLGQSYVGVKPPGMGDIHIPLISDIPVFGPVLFQHDPILYIGIALTATVWVTLKYTRVGLILRAVGENHDAAHALGYKVIKIRVLAIMFGGACAGLGGAYISLIRVPQWTEGMTAGVGWIALALVVFASWKPWRALLGAYLFGGITVLQLNLQAAGVAIPVEYLAMSPYIITILVLVIPFGRQEQRTCLTGSILPRRALSAAYRTNLWSNNMKFTSILTGAALALGLATSAMAQDKTKVGFVYVGPVGDGGWTYEHDKGRLAVEEHFGDKVETVFVESVPEGPDAERVMTQMALEGADLIFTTSFGYMDPTINVAKKFPNVKFEHATGYKTAPNVSVYSARFYEGRAVQGHIAGKMTESNTIGYIGSYPIPEVIRGINSAYIHAKKVNPDVEFKIVWAYTWFDPAKEADAAKVLIRAGRGRDPAAH